MICEHLENVAEILNGFAFKSSLYCDTGIRVLRIANVQDGFIADSIPCFYPNTMYEQIKPYELFEGDLLMSLTGNVGRVGIVKKELLPAALNQRVCCIRPNDRVSSKFLYFYFLQKSFSHDCIVNSKGVAQLNLSTKWLANVNVPVPPFPEQQRIVAKIEELFAELDNSVAMLKKVKEQLEVYRQAVLEKAFEIADESVLLREYIEKPTYGTSQKCTYDKKKNSIAVYRIPNISDYGGHIDHSDLKYAVFSNEDKAKYVLKENDILIIRSNGSEDVVGQVALVRNKDINGLFAGYLIRLRIKQNVSLCAKYLFYFLQSFKARKYIVSTAKSTNGINNINAEEIQNISIPFCEHEKQIEAVTFIENNLSLCRQLNENTSVGLKQADALRQSILKKAFEGEL